MEEKGVWRTIRGRRVFIREGEDLASAMKRSGKFKDTTKQGEVPTKSTINTMTEKNSDIAEKIISDDEWNDVKVTRYGNGNAVIENERTGQKVKITPSDTKESLSRKIKDSYKATEDDYKEKYSHAFPFHKQTEKEKKYADDVAEYFKGKDIKEEYIKVKRYPDDPNNKEYTSVLRNPYNSKMYAKELSESYMSEEEYENKSIPKYIQDIDAGRYGNMSDEQAIKNWIDGGADVIYNDDAEKLLKQWDIPIKNDDAYGTYKSELAKQLLPIYKQDKSTSLSKMSLSELRKTAQEYNIDTTGLSEQKLRAKLIAIFK